MRNFITNNFKTKLPELLGVIYFKNIKVSLIILGY